MPSAFSTALAGLTAHSIGIDAVGNNLANLNTTGFKASSVAFRDLVTQSIGVGNEAGLGTSLPQTSRYFTQGSIQSSSGSMDAALKGDGFFVVRSLLNNAVEYTRAGNFRVDRDGFLVTSTGERVQGWVAVNGVLNTNIAANDIQLPVAALQTPVPTSQMSLDANLNASAEVGESFSNPIEVFDSLGKSHILTFTFTKTGTNAWECNIYIPARDLDESAAASDPPVLVNGPIALEFGANGLMSNPDANVTGITVAGLANGASDITFDWNLFAGAVPRLTQYDHPSAVSGNAQNGRGASQLVKVAMADNGAIMAQFSNGQQKQIGQLAVAAIRNPESLRAVGNNLFQQGANTADPAIGLPNTGGRGQVLGGALEASNVDIAREFTQLIILQRGYQANSRVVVTADEVSQETINMKR